MIATERLIDDLAREWRPRGNFGPSLRLVSAIACGALVALAGLLLVLGRPLAAVPHTGVPAFVMKISFAVAVMALAGLLLFASGRPGRRLGKRLAWLALPPALIVAAAAMELAMIAPATRESAWLGSTWLTCLIAITGFSLPVLAGISWAFRRLAPTNLELSGFLAGITSGGAAAVVYALYCPETTATFLASWYTAGILAAGLIGRIAGPRLLRW